MKQEELLKYFSEHGVMSDPGVYRDALFNLPSDTSEICRIVQNCLIHPMWLERYGVQFDKDKLREK